MFRFAPDRPQSQNLNIQNPKCQPNLLDKAKTNMTQFFFVRFQKRKETFHLFLNLTFSISNHGDSFCEPYLSIYEIVSAHNDCQHMRLDEK
jgi:hypothetical protein